MKHTKALFLLPLLLCSSLFAETSFSGNTGIAAKFVNQKARSIDPSLNLDGYFAGQLSFGNSLHIRGEFSVQTDDIYDDIFKETSSVFRIDELSATYVRSFYGFTHFLSFFFGTFEPIGDESFLQRNLGVEKFSSMLTENYLGVNGCNVYDFYGYGGAYSLRFSSAPVTTGIQIYKNNENEDEDKQLNGDWRFGAAFKYLTIDSTIGLSAPMYTKNSKGENVVLLIEEIYMHTGIDLILGNRNGTGIFIQTGFENLPVKSDNEKKIDVKDFYLLVEPRFDFGFFKTNLSFFNMPEEQYKKTLLIDEMLGFNLCVMKDDFAVKGKNAKAGLNCTVSFEGKDLKDFDDDDLRDTVKVKLSPFFKIEMLGGELNSLLQFNVTKFADSDPESLKLTLAYRKNL